MFFFVSEEREKKMQLKVLFCATRMSLEGHRDSKIFRGEDDLQQVRPSHFNIMEVKYCEGRVSAILFFLLQTTEAGADGVQEQQVEQKITPP